MKLKIGQFSNCTHTVRNVAQCEPGIIILFLHEGIHNSKDFHRLTTYEQLTKRCINASGSQLHILQVFVFSIDIFLVFYGSVYTETISSSCLSHY